MRAPAFSPRAWPLRRKAFALLLLASVIPLVLVSALMLSRERLVVRDASIALLDARIDEVGHTLEAIYLGYRQETLQAARDAEVIRYCAGTAEMRHRSRTSMRRLLEVLRGDDPAIRGVGIVDRDGVVVAATEPQLLGANLGYREHVRRALGGDPAVSEVYVSIPSTGQTPSVAFTAPIRIDGAVIGAYVLWLRAAVIWDVLRAANGSAGRGSFFALFDRHGIRVGHSANEQLLFHPSVHLSPAATRELLAERRFQERTTRLISEVIPFPYEEIRGRFHHVFRRPASPTNNADNLAVARYFPGLGATVVGHVPEHEVEIGVASLLPRVLPAILVGLFLVSIGGAFFMRHVVSPLVRLAAAAVALERGRFEPAARARVEVDGRYSDEIGLLARAFGSMARSLAERDCVLRERNRELERKQRALVTLTACNEALVRASDEPALLQAVGDAIVRDGGYRMCWVGFAEQDERKSVRPVAHAGDDEGYVANVDVVWADTERGRGPVGTSIRTGRPVVTREVGSDPAFRPWGAEAAKRGYASVAAFPIVSEEGVTLGSLAIYSADVSAFDEAEMALLRELAGDLAYGITALRGRAERLAMTARLLQADRMVAVGTLAAGVAHEINNPLAYVVSAATFTRDELGRLERELPAGRLDELKRASRDAEDGLRRVTTIVRDLKTYSRADEERSGRVELHAVLESSVNMALNEIKHRARLAEDYGQIPPVIGNEARLGQVFLNLLVNAAQAIPEGRMDENEIRVSTRTDDRGRAVISIRDSGTGIEPEVLRHVFEPFFTTKPVGVGTGLGLFVCRNIIDALGGEIEIDSEPGAGTVVRVILPAAPAGEPRALPPPPVVAEVPPNGRRGRVLVVDDEPAIGYALRRLLQKEHDVVVLASAREARDRVAGGERFDAIACDLMMPVMTGIDLFDALTAIAPDQADRMILLTGGAFTTTAREFLQRWPHPCLEKPIEAERLRALVHALVGRAAHGPAGGAENTAPADRWRYAAPLES